MLDSKGFDLWADGYDEAVGVSDEENAYPFAGYKEVLAQIYRQIMVKPKASVMDIGFGTAALTARLYDNGCDIYGQDFSPAMMEAASRKMPSAHLYQGDFAEGLSDELLNRSYDFIVATYSLHHLNDDEKVSFIKMLLGLLNDGGKILIGDVAFKTRRELEECWAEAGDEWDDEEIYFVADELRKSFPGLKFAKISHCSGIITLEK